MNRHFIDCAVVETLLDDADTQIFRRVEPLAEIDGWFWSDAECADYYERLEMVDDLV